MKNVLINLFALLLLLFVVYKVSQLGQKKLLIANSLELQNIVPPQQQDVESYSDINLHAPTTKCSDINVYEDLPLVIIESNTPLPSSLVQEESSLKCKLYLNNNGILEYYLDDVLVWSSKNPRQIKLSTQLRVLQNAIKEKDAKEWKKVYENDMNFKLHISPLGITDKNSKIIWTFMSGWETSQKDTSLPHLHSGISKAIIISDNRQYRLALLSNSDLVILKAAKDPENISKQKVELHASIIQSFCKI